jgi:hypothetical protein
VTYLIDMHEGYDYFRSGTGSVGQSMIYYPRGDDKAIATKVVNTLNKSISTKSHYFTVLVNPVSGSLAASTGKFLGVHSFILETSSTQALNTRINQQVAGVKVVLQYLGMY